MKQQSAAEAACLVFSRHLVINQNIKYIKKKYFDMKDEDKKWSVGNKNQVTMPHLMTIHLIVMDIFHKKMWKGLEDNSSELIM